MNWNKKSIARDIQALESAIVMAADIEATVKDFEHYKQVDKRFVDAIKAKGYHCWKIKDGNKTKIQVNCKDKQSSEFDWHDFYITDYGQPITCQRIRDELKRYNYAGQLETAKRRLEVFDAEKQVLTELVEHIKGIKLLCFSTSKAERELQHALDVGNMLRSY